MCRGTQGLLDTSLLVHFDCLQRIEDAQEKQELSRAALRAAVAAAPLPGAVDSSIEQLSAAVQHLEEVVAELNEGEEVEEGELEAASGLLALFTEELQLARTRDSLVRMQHPSSAWI
jgi:hypothetical protein